MRPFHPREITDLALYMDPELGVNDQTAYVQDVSTWVDQSDNALSFSQGSEGNKPHLVKRGTSFLRKQPQVLFVETASMHLDGSDVTHEMLYSNTHGMTIFWAGYVADDEGQFVTKYDASSGLREFYIDQKQFIASEALASYAAANKAAITVVEDSKQIIVGRWKPATETRITRYLGGATTGTASTPAVHMHDGSEPVRLGNYDGGSYDDSRWGICLIYKRALGLGEQSRVIEFMASLYGVLGVTVKN
jgi:hypothetical protein